MPQAAGTAADQLPTNADLGAFAFMQLEAFLIRPPASATPHNPGDVVVQATDSALTFKRKLANGTVVSASLAWA